MNTMIVGNIEESSLQSPEFVESICRCLHYLAAEAAEAGLSDISHLLEQCAGDVQTNGG